MKKSIIVFVLLIAAGLVWKFFGADIVSDKQKENIKEPQTVLVQKGALKIVVEATGRVVPEQEVEIKCKASGEVIKLPFDVSDNVKKGELLLQIDPENEERSVKRAEVALAVSQAKLRQARLNLQIAERDLVTERTRAEAAVKSAQAKIQETQARLERVQQLFKKEMTTREELEIVQTNHTQAWTELENANARVKDLGTREVQIASRRQDIKISQEQVESDKISLFDARQRLEDTTVVAPIDGVVAEQNVQVGQIIASGINNVGGGTTVMRLADLSHIYVLAAVDESDIGRIALEQRASITVDAYPETAFAGKVVRVATKGVIVTNVVTFEVKIEVEGENRQLLKPEMTANVEIIAAEKKKALLIPVSAVVQRQREKFVKVNTNAGEEERRVSLGLSDGEFVEVLAGLREGDEVVLSGEAQGRWGKKEKKDDKKGGSVRNDIRRMRMMGGGRR